MKLSQAFIASALAVTSASAQAVVLTQLDGSQCNHGAPNSTACGRAITDHLTAVCYPNGTSGPDYTAPCIALTLIEAQCTYGNEPGLKQGQELLSSFGKRDNNAPPPEISNSTQRQCICESQFFNAYQGCASCLTKHGASAKLPIDIVPGPDLRIASDQIDAMSKAYCAASSTPTADLGDMLFSLYISVDPSATVVPTRQPTTRTSQTYTLSDSLGNKTEASLYYTPTVTGKAFWCPAIPTGSPSTSNGQIVAVSATGSCTETAPSATNSSTGAAPSATKTSGADGLAVIGGGALMVLGSLVVAVL